MQREKISYYYGEPANSSAPTFTVHNGFNRSILNRNTERLRGPDNDWEEPTYHENWNFNRKSSKQNGRRRSEMVSNKNKDNRKVNSNGELHAKEYSSKRRGQGDALPETPPVATALGHDSPDVGPSREKWGVPENKIKYMKGKRENRTRTRAIYGIIFLVVLALLIIFGAGLYVILLFWGPFAATSQAVTTAQPYVPVTAGAVMVVVVGVELDATVRLSNRAFIPAYNNDLSPQYQELAQNFTNTMDAVFYNSDLRDVYNGTTVNGFRQGSVVVNFTINLIRAPMAPTQNPAVTDPSTPSSGIGSIEEQIDRVRGQVEVSIKEIIQVAENNGDLTTLGVEATTFSVTDVSVDVEVTTPTETPPTTMAPSTVAPDDEPPVITCPSDVTAETEAGEAFGIVSWNNPTATDNSGEVTVETNFVPGQLPIGSRNITATATDPSGNTAECVFVVTVIDTEAPAAICLEDITRNTDVAQSYATVSWSSPRGTDNSGTISSISTDPSEGQFEIGSHVITVTVVDPAGLEGQCTFDVVVEDDELPDISCPASITQPTDLGSTTAMVTWQVSATDNSGESPAITSAPPPGSFSLGTVIVIATASDSSGNMASCNFTVTVVDEEAPSITCPDNIMVAADVGASSAIVTWIGPFASDNSGQVTVQTDVSPGLLPIGIQTITGTAADGSGNEAQCTFLVNVQDLENPVVTCPSDITAELMLNPVTWEATATDNSETIAVLTSSPSSSDLMLGTNNVTVVAEDPSGNKAVCTFIVTLTDSTPPVITCPDDVTATLASGQSTVTVTWVEPTGTDLSGQITVIASHSPGDYTLGQVNVTATATDSSGNQATCFFLVTVTDDQSPMINNCPPSQSVNTDSGLATAVVSWTPPIASDNSGSVTLTSDYEPGSAFPIGNTRVTYTATDSSGNSVMTCTFDVAVHDNERPAISGCPLGVSVNTDSGLATGIANWTEPTASDNSGIQTLTPDYSPGNPFPIGLTTVTYTATDGSGNSQTCTFNVIVLDNERPVISGCPSLLTVNTDSGLASWMAYWTEPTASDNSGVQTLVSDYYPGYPMPIGSTTVTYTSTDVTGNSVTCMFVVTVIDDERPVISGCPNPITVNTDSSLATGIASWTEPTALDNSGFQTLTSDYKPGDPFPIGSTTVTYTSVDGSGNNDTCRFDVTVIDNERPVISGCPGSLTVNTDSTLASGTASWTEPTASDNSGSQTLTPDYNPGDSFPIGSTTVRYTSIDGSGNSNTCSFNVTVIDNERPVISGCPSSVSVNADSGKSTGTAMWTEPTASDNSGSQTLMSDYNSGDPFPVGNTNVTYTSTDDAGNIDTCRFEVTVIGNASVTIDGSLVIAGTFSADLTDPSTALYQRTAGDLVSGFDAIFKPLGSQYIGTTVNGFRNGSIEAGYSVNLESLIESNGTDPLKATTRMINDSINNGINNGAFGDLPVVPGSSSVQQDTEPPVIYNCPSSLTIATDSADSSGTATWTEPTASDNSGPPTVTSDYNPGDSFPIGSTAVTYTFTDGSGNSASCSFNVTVTDDENPVITGCPSNQNVNTDPGNATAVVTWTPPNATDNSGNQTLTSTNNPGDYFPIGNNTVTYTSTDAAGNTDTCTFYVVVTDDENPEITGCPSDQNVNTDAGNAIAVVTWTPPTATDNAGTQTLTSANSPGDYFPIGNNTVNYTSTDAAGNTDTCTFYVVVTDNENPEFSGCPSDQNVNTDAGNATAVVSWTPPNATDNSGNYNLTSTDNPGDYFPVGNNTVTYKSTDAAGNTAMCIFYIVITDAEAPSFSSCPSDRTRNTATDRDFRRISWTEPTVTDNVDAPMDITITQTHNRNDRFYVGTSTVVYEATDSSGNKANCSFQVTIYDDQAPGVTGCPSNINTPTDSGQSYANVSWIEPVFTDNVGIVNVTSTHSPLDLFSIGVTEVVYNGFDDAGSYATCSFNVSVYDNENPVISGCPSDQNVNTDPGNATAVVTWTPPSAMDNSGTQTLTSTNNPGDYFPIGNNTVTYTAKDVAGNIDACTFYLVVIDNESPVISGCPSDQSVNTDPGNATAVVSWTAPTATDNSGNQTLASTDSPRDKFPIGNSTVTYTSTDAAGNTDICTFYVVVTDGESPVITGCPSDQSVNTDPGNATAVVTWTPPTVTDNSGSQTLTSATNPGDYFPIGNNTVTYTAKDVAGNIDTCTFYLVVIDNEKPVISGCPSSQSVNTDPGNATAVVTWTPPTATDNAGTQTLTPSHNPGDYFPIGNNTVTYTSTDAAGNTDTCTFYVVVTDGESPVITGCPSDQSVNTDPGNATAVVTWTPPTVTDNSGSQTLTSATNPGDYFPIGNNTVTYTAKDVAGNTDTCTFYLVVIDNESPVISGCPSDQSVNTDPGNATAVVSWTAPNATDNSGSQTLNSTDNPGDTFPIGNNTVTYTSTDAAGNTDTCTFYVVVIDAEAPSFSSCPSDRTRNTYTDKDFRRLNWPVPTATDNVDAPMNITVTQTHNPGDRFYVGVTTVVYEATDLSGNTANCSFQVTIYDDQAPTVTDCLSNINTSTESGQSYANVSWIEPVFTDNVDIVNVTSTHSPLDLFSTGVTEVSYNGLDEAGNIATCLFNVTVYDLEAPVLRDCPSDVTRNTGIGRDYRRVSWTEPIVTDNVDARADLSVTQTHTSNQQFYVGVTTVVFEATDLSGNVGNCSFIITVYDVHAPTVTDCPSNINVTTDSGQSYATVNWTEPVFTDNVDIANVTSTHSPLDEFSIGVTEVVYNGSDDAGNIATCSFSVTVYDVTEPQLSCPTSIYFEASAETSVAMVTWNVTALDNSGVDPTITASMAPGNYTVGSYAVVVTATDGSGNSVDCTITLEVIGACGLYYFSCDLSVCLPNEWLCDGVPDCPDQSDESGCVNPPAVVNPASCGLTPAITPRIVGGTDALPGGWPWIASLSIRVSTLPFYHICSASLISDQWAITAAHCILPDALGLIADRIVLGDNELYSSTATEQSADIESIYIHPGFNDFALDFDIALLKLARPVEIDDYVRPICLETTSEEVNVYSQCVTVGWGRTDASGGLSQSLQEANFNLTEIEECRNITLDPSITDNQICAWDPSGGVSICGGDSGGSLVCQEYSGAWRLVGITSASYGCADADNPSVNNLPDIYTRVSRYWDWINSVIEGTPKYTCEPVTIPTCAAVLPYNTTYATSQSPSYEFFIAVLELVQDRTCHPNLDTLVCASILRECRPDDPGRVPCKEMCEEVRTACEAELQVFGAYLDLVLPCDSYPTGPSNDTLLCEYGVDYACGNTDLTVTRGVPVVLSNPSFPSYGVDELSCTWYASVSNPGDVLIIKFRVLSLDTVVGTLLIGEGSDSANLTSVIAEVRASSTAIETGLGRIWLTYASFLSSRGFELELWAVESGSADFCSEGSDAVVCSSGLSCVPADWVCDGVTDCESGEDEASCTVPLNCSDGYVSCQSVAECIPLAWQCDAINDCQDSSDEMDCDEPIDCGGNFTCASETECVLLSDVCDFFPDCTDFSDEADCQYITFEEVYLSANESYELYSPAFPSSYPTDLNYTWHIQVPAPYVIGIDFVAFDTESGVDILELWEDERSNKTSRRILRWSGSMIPDDIKTNSSDLWAYFHSSQFQSASGFAASVYPADPGPGSTTVTPTTGPVVDISLTVNEIYTLTSPGYPSNYDISLNLLWSVLAPPSYRVLISPTNFSTEVFYDFLSVGEGLTLDLDTLVVQFSGTYDVPEVLMPGREAWIWFFSDGSITSSGFRLEITTSNTADGECGASYISCYTTDVCISDSATCDENPACINGDDEINCDPSCPDSSILAINSSMPYPVMSDNYPFGYANDIQCLWLLQAPPSHSLVIDIEDFTLETSYDFLYIGLGHDRVDEDAVVLQLTGTIAPTRYYLGNQSYLYFVTDYSVSSPGFSLNVTSIPFELTESCDADQRVPVGSSCDGVANCFDNSDEIGCVCSEDQYQCSNGFCMPLSVLCDGVMDCGDFSDEEDCPRCEPIQQSSCLSVLPYNETYYPSTGGDNQTLAVESYNLLTAATMCHSDAHLYLCAALFPECIHDGPTARPCRSTCEAVQSACSTSFENLNGYPWPFACEELSNESPIGDGSLCRGPEGDITNTMICGTRPVFNEGGDRIVGGEDSVPGEWPWIGSLRRSGTNHQCGATLINEEWAITAAHCVGLFDTITVGDINLLTGTPYHHTSALDIYSHPNFTSVGGGDDIALVRLLDPILDFSDYVRPICLATVGDEINNYKTCYIAGWGATAQGGSGSTDLQQAVVGLIPDEDCASAYSSFRADSMICAGYLAGEVDTCQGDSGGPLMCEGTDGRWHLVGITSFGNGCARPNYPGVYTRVSPFIDFIMSTIENGF